MPPSRFFIPHILSTAIALFTASPSFAASKTWDAGAATDLVFTVKWSDGMQPGSWTPSGIAHQNPAPIAENATTETLRISVPIGSNRRFVRLEITKP